MKVIGVDVGGTFTDLIYSDLETGAMSINKVPTTPEDPSTGVMKGIEGLLASAQRKPDEIDFVFHATTTATNAVLEDKGARAGMITNEGFRDVLHIGRHQRVEHYSIRQELPWQNRPLIKRRDRKVVQGRLAPPHGEELEPLDEEGVRSAAIALGEAGVESVAICFLFSYLNPAHEDRVKAIVSEILPEAFVTTSSFVSPQFREFERFTTAALAAFIGPKVRMCITHLDRSLKSAGLAADLENHGLERRRGDCEHGVGEADADASLRLGGRRAGGGMDRRARGATKADHVRHWGHERGHRNHRRWKVGGNGRTFDVHRRLPAAHAHD